MIFRPLAYGKALLKFFKRALLCFHPVQRATCLRRAAAIAGVI